MAIFKKSDLLCAMFLMPVLVIGACHAAEPPLKVRPSAMRRITVDQYRQIIVDVFGPEIQVPARLETSARKDGLVAIGAGSMTIAAPAFEQYHVASRGIAAQVIDERNREVFVPCRPASARAADDTCARQFIAKYGRLLLRRPLGPQELQNVAHEAAEASLRSHDFYAGLGSALITLLDSPEFLFRIDAVDQEVSPAVRSSRLSFFLWNTTPDQELLTKAEAGELDTAQGLQRQVDRLIASPRFEVGVRAFFSDMLQLDDFNFLTKDVDIYPKYSAKLANDAKEQTLMFLTDMLVKSAADYRDIFTASQTFLSRPLGMIYHVPVNSRDGWERYVAPESSPRIGILTQASFLELHSHPGRSSPTLRGKALRELLLCQRVPAPPANVNFDAVQDTNKKGSKTSRARLEAHQSNPVCAGCHKITDPIGLALENFDSAGEYRATENGEEIDVSGELGGKKFHNIVEFAAIIRDDPAVPACLVKKLFSYATGRSVRAEDKEWLTWLEGEFAQSGFRVPELMRTIAMSKGMYDVGRGDLPQAK